MRSARPKVLHTIAGRSLLAHVLDAVRKAGGTMTAVVVGPGARCGGGRSQADRCRLPRSSCKRSGAAPLMPCWPQSPRSRAARRRARDLRRHAADPAADAGAACARASPKARRSWCLAFARRTRRVTGGWCIEGGELVAIREELDASPAERAIELCNGGLMAFAGPTALAILERIGNDNRKGEYLSDRRHRHRPGHGTQSDGHRDRGGRRARYQHQRAARGGRSRAAAAAAQGGDGGGRHADRAGDGVSVVRHQVRPRRGGRAVRGVRTGRHGRGQAPDPLLLASRRRACGQGRVGRALCAAASRRATSATRCTSAISSRSRRP